MNHSEDRLDLAISEARLRTDDPLRYTIGIRAGRIVSIVDSREPLPAARQVLSAEGRWVIPGAIDSHAHIDQRAPEYDHLEGLGPDDNFAVESQSAVAGGCTTALNYVRFDSSSIVRGFVDGAERAQAQSRMNVLFHGCLMNMEHVNEIPQAIAAGVRSFKIFMPYRGSEARNLGGIGSLNHAEMREAFARLAGHGGQALVHAEDGDIVDACVVQERARGLDSLDGWDRSRPAIAEGDAAWTAIYLAEEANCPVTIVHVSSLEAMRARDALGWEGVSLESCAHYLLLSTESPIGPLGKVAPPLRTPDLAEEITQAVMDGRIDFFGSDHNVWPSAAKAEWESAKPGLPGIGLMLPLLLSELYCRRGASMESLIALTSTNAARKFGLDTKGVVAIGKDADLVIVEEGERVIRANDLHSAIDYSPYDGKHLLAWPATTICGGTIIYHDGQLVNQEHRGEILNDRFAVTVRKQ